MYLTSLFLLFTLLAGVLSQDGSQLTTLAQLERVNADLTKYYKLDPTNLPFAKANIRDQGDSCSQARLRPRQGLPLAVPVEFFDWHTLYKIDHVTITNINYTDAETINNTKDPSTFSVATSTAVADAVTSGWTISASGSYSMFSISGTHQESTTHTVTQTKTVTNTITCQVGELCRFQTFTFTANIFGTCYNQTWTSGDGDSDRRLCKDQNFSRCAAIESMYDQICTDGKDTSQPDIPCMISVPIFDGSADGSLLSMVVESSEKA